MGFSPGYLKNILIGFIDLLSYIKTSSYFLFSKIDNRQTFFWVTKFVTEVITNGEEKVQSGGGREERGYIRFFFLLD